MTKKKRKLKRAEWGIFFGPNFAKLKCHCGAEKVIQFEPSDDILDDSFERAGHEQAPGWLVTQNSIAECPSCRTARETKEGPMPELAWGTIFGGQNVE